MIIYVTDRNGKEHELQALNGWRIMEIIRDHAINSPELGIKAECGGAMACATCHVYINKEWVSRLNPPSNEEIDQMDGAFEVEACSRLSCQIIMSKETNGLKLRLAPGSEP